MCFIWSSGSDFKKGKDWGNVECNTFIFAHFQAASGWRDWRQQPGGTLALRCRLPAIILPLDNIPLPGLISFSE